MMYNSHYFVCRLIFLLVLERCRQQIMKRLQEKGQITDDKLLYDVSCYATRVSALLVSKRLLFIMSPYFSVDLFFPLFSFFCVFLWLDFGF
jgi:hypothetical protein